MNKIIECSSCGDDFDDFHIWWSGYFWFCFPCAVALENEANYDEEDLCSCRDDEINVQCRGCF